MGKSVGWLIAVVAVLLIGLVVAIPFVGAALIRDTAKEAVAPVADANNQLKTQVSVLLHPTPTIIPDPVTIIQEVRTLARLETIQYSVEKVITAETGQGEFGFLFGDKLLLVAHGTVIAGVDLEKLTSQDVWMDGRTLHVRLPEPEIFVATLNNDQSYIYDRKTGVLTHGDTTLETRARQAAEQEIQKAAEQDGILKLARQNAETYLVRLFKTLGYPEVVFETKK